MCKALRTYIYGYSKFVEQHKKALQRLSFPRKIACFGGEDTELIVKANQKLIIREDDDKPVFCQLKKVTVESGGQIVFEGHVDFETKSIIQKGFAKIDGLLLSRGSDGGNGGNGGAGGQGANGAQSKDGSKEKNGGNGANGIDGAPGGNGGNSNEVRITLRDIEIQDVISVGSIGGNGGNAGDGADVIITIPKGFTKYIVTP